MLNGSKLEWDTERIEVWNIFGQIIPEEIKALFSSDASEISDKHKIKLEDKDKLKRIILLYIEDHWRTF